MSTEGVQGKWKEGTEAPPPGVQNLGNAKPDIGGTWKDASTGQGEGETWMNPATGQIIKVQQIINDGNDMLAITNNGPMKMSEFSQYIQVSDDMVEDPFKKDNNVEFDTSEFAKVEQPFSLDKPLNSQQNSLLNQPLTNTSSKIAVETKNVEDEIMDRIFGKIETEPEIKFNIDWSNFPIKKIIGTAQMLDISTADIAKEIIKRYFKTENIYQSLQKMLDGDIY